MPVGAAVSCEVAAPTWRTFWYSRSSNTARSFLKPLVLTFARLWETTVMRVCCASSPVLAAHSAEFIGSSPSLHGQQPRRGGAVVFGSAHGAHLQVEPSRQLDHVDHRVGHSHVAALQHAGRES